MGNVRLAAGPYFPPIASNYRYLAVLAAAHEN
jgi:hypothetical protein